MPFLSKPFLSVSKHLRTAFVAAALAWSGHASALERLTVQTAFYPQGPQAYLFLAKHKGWFEAAGLDVELLDGRGSNFSMQVVSSGHADVGEGQLAPIVPARDKGAKVKAIAEWYKKDGPAIIVPVDSGMTKPADLKGKKVVIIASGPWPPLLNSFFAQFDMKPSDMQLMYVESTALFTTYAIKQADAMLTVDLAYTEANPLRASNLISSLDFGVKLPGNGLYATEETIAKRGDALKRFIEVCARAMAYIYDGHEEEGARAIRAQRPNTKLSAEHILEQIKFFQSLRFAPSGEGKPVGWQSPQDWQERMAYVKAAGIVKTDHAGTDFFTNAFTEGLPR
ncbi:ABC transporter substrate-binding protein [Methylocella sp. CPCC 101449]|uniref:ABC transporter substrate-binding protein n=1 Tax=Methylocella sp. CPCC 101449 TaxID=2987531 RepID=UPI00288EAC84|nr:ABC transporter substrate-binding protein [Methylocella sp. CPCC 101449]MDT2021759.1 ABC transporter substrate-binding protein [Methylocella sp. CPCC 101449]